MNWFLYDRDFHHERINLCKITTLLILLKAAGKGANLSTCNLLTLLFKLFKLVGRHFNLSISNLSTSDFTLAKSNFLAKDDVSTPAVFFKSAFVA